ncbi:LuxR family transcriptional regulator [Loktanella fryxellensis]|uniref:LuxR family transcriptional regulator n=1 Tax=Loktanella fryxellensis TaxID=245187 RepID=A0A1H7YFG8_9RHOB|nr:autoinducer binding domain-containing protein [Loktanella fryxellensis]SEM44860.1 LuxR family transcriptional regulator [Loktanella fryxellensis]
MTRAMTLDDTMRMACTLAPAGVALGLHVGFAAPRFLLQTYPRAWTQIYSGESLAVTDPTIHWGFAHTGACRWSALPAPVGGVLSRAADHGLRFGVVCAVAQGGGRSLGSFARSDRELTAPETAQALQILTDLHTLALNVDTLSPAEAARLRQWSGDSTIAPQTFTAH